jgi:flagella basal body P-ring formation protein FlgA
VQVWTHHWVAKRNLPAGHRLSPDDFKPVHGPKSRMDGELAANPDLWAGQELARPLSEGQPLRLNNWRVLTVIRRGMEVQVKILGKGFEITSSGVALTDAAQGASFQVRGKDGKTFQALAVAEGWAEIRMD